MNHPEIENRTPFAFDPLFAYDEEGRPLYVPLVRATYELVNGRLWPTDEQAPPPLGGELYGADAATSSYKHEPEAAFVKPATDVVLLGTARAPRRGAVDSHV